MVFRDLKPENVLVNKNGYLKLADFGFIKKLAPWERTSTFCGTPEYIAPEIILNKGYSQPVDWYALGIFLYELLYGRPPFMANDPYEIFQMVLKEKIKFTRDFDKHGKSLVKKLCDHDLSKRLGNLRGGVKDIKTHKFFKSVDWEALLAQKVRPAHIPEIPVKKVCPCDGMLHKNLTEGNDNAKFPPIKVTKDPFLTWL